MTSAVYVYELLTIVWGQDGWILAKLFFGVFMGREGVEVYKHAKKKRMRPLSSHLELMLGQ